MRAVSGLHRDWGLEEELRAATVEQLQLIVSLLHHAWFKAPHPEPVQVPRPGQNGQASGVGEMVAPPKMSTREEIRSFFGGEGVKAVYSES